MTVSAYTLYDEAGNEYIFEKELGEFDNIDILDDGIEFEDDNGKKVFVSFDDIETEYE